MQCCNYYRYTTLHFFCTHTHACTHAHTHTHTHTRTHTHTHTHTTRIHTPQAFLALLALSTATGEVDVIHEEGRCFWSGECPIDVCGKTVSEKNYNIFNNSMAFNLTAEEDSELYGLIEEMCPMYIGGL